MFIPKVKSAAIEKIYAAINEAFPEHLARCRAVLRQKSVSATGEGIRETAHEVKGFIEELGGEASFWQDPSLPHGLWPREWQISKDPHRLWDV